VLSALQKALAETGFDTPPPQLWGEQIEDRGAQITWSALGQQAPIEVKSVWDPDRKKRAPLQAALIAHLSDFSVRANATTSIDITRAGINKAYGVRKLSEIINAPIENMVYVGDALFPGGNDEVVKETGIKTHEVKDPSDTEKFIQELLAAG
jgi:hydroxymethylpyrimidine pyrophosphatase-like HAD family hydrolase